MLTLLTQPTHPLTGRPLLWHEERLSPFLTE